LQGTEILRTASANAKAQRRNAGGKLTVNEPRSASLIRPPQRCRVGSSATSAGRKC